MQEHDLTGPAELLVISSTVMQFGAKILWLLQAGVCAMVRAAMGLRITYHIKSRL